jgi:hypothetical protein
MLFEEVELWVFVENKGIIPTDYAQLVDYKNKRQGKAIQS